MTEPTAEEALKNIKKPADIFFDKVDKMFERLHDNPSYMELLEATKTARSQEELDDIETYIDHRLDQAREEQQAQLDELNNS